MGEIKMIDYPQLPTPESIPKTKNNKNFIFCVVSASILICAIWTLFLLGAFQLGLSDAFVPDHICNERIENATNMSFINGSVIGFELGRIKGAIDISQGVIANDTMPVFFPINETTIGFNMVNMKDYYLNQTGGK